MTMIETFSGQLRAGCAADWRAATCHRFVGELANDTISDTDYARYLILDYAFLDIRLPFQTNGTHSLINIALLFLRQRNKSD